MHVGLGLPLCQASSLLDFEEHQFFCWEFWRKENGEHPAVKLCFFFSVFLFFGRFSNYMVQLLKPMFELVWEGDCQIGQCEVDIGLYVAVDDDDEDDVDECRSVVRRNKKVICQWCSPLFSLLALRQCALVLLESLFTCTTLVHMFTSVQSYTCIPVK